MVDDHELPAAFLEQLGRSLKSLKDVDGDLADILAQHVLTAEPAENCVDTAVAAIAALAIQRASGDEEQANG